MSVPQAADGWSFNLGGLTDWRASQRTPDQGSSVAGAVTADWDTRHSGGEATRGARGPPWGDVLPEDAGWRSSSYCRWSGGGPKASKVPSVADGLQTGWTLFMRDQCSLQGLSTRSPLAPPPPLLLLYGRTPLPLDEDDEDATKTLTKRRTYTRDDTDNGQSPRYIETYFLAFWCSFTWLLWIKLFDFIWFCCWPLFYRLIFSFVVVFILAMVLFIYLFIYLYYISLCFTLVLKVTWLFQDCLCTLIRNWSFIRWRLHTDCLPASENKS